MKSITVNPKLKEQIKALAQLAKDFGFSFKVESKQNQE